MSIVTLVSLPAEIDIRDGMNPTRRISNENRFRCGSSIANRPESSVIEPTDPTAMTAAALIG
jgi:hypothetical protein